jgi:hypothetical protein
MQPNRMPSLILTVGDGYVTVRSRRGSRARVARILGDEATREGGRRITLDRLIHASDDDAEDYRLEGCVVTVLVRESGRRPCDGREKHTSDRASVNYEESEKAS